MKKAVGEHLETDSFLNGEKLSSDNDTNSYVQIKYVANLHPAWNLIHEFQYIWVCEVPQCSSDLG